MVGCVPTKRVSHEFFSNDVSLPFENGFVYTFFPEVKTEVSN